MPELPEVQTTSQRVDEKGRRTEDNRRLGR